MRYERKFQYLPCYGDLISVFLKCNRFKEIYHKRIINSLYYESDNFDLYQDSINGLNKKQKIRLRFYDSDGSKSRIEYKNKVDLVNEKKYSNLENNKNNQLLPVYFKDKNYIIENLYAPRIIDCFYKPKVMVSYTRFYFISDDEELRITLDSEIYFMKANLNSSFINIGKRRGLDKAILEMKYREDYYPDLKFINSICTKFGMNLSTFSKYSTAVSLLNLV